MRDEQTPDFPPAATASRLPFAWGALQTLVALLGAMGAGLAVAGGTLRAIEFAFVCLAALVCEQATGRNRLPIELAAGLTFVVIEAIGGRINTGNLWLEGVGAAGVFVSARASSRLGDERRGHEREIARSRARLVDSERDRKLRGELALGGMAPAAYELERARRHDRPLAVLVVVPDSDSSNDGAALEVASRIASSIRLSDIPVGVEGDGFLLLLPETGALEARIVAERVRLDVAAEHVSSVSIGISGYPGDASDEAELVAAARDAAARARDLGGNRTVLYSIPPGYPAGWGLEPPLTRSDRSS